MVFSCKWLAPAAWLGLVTGALCVGPASYGQAQQPNALVRPRGDLLGGPIAAPEAAPQPAAVLPAQPGKGKGDGNQQPEPIPPPAVVEKIGETGIPPGNAASRWPWMANLPYRPIPPLGNSPILPTGPGYYSLRDVATGTYRDEPPRSPYPPYGLMRNSFFDADFRYLDDPNYVPEYWYEQLHNIHLGDDFLFGTGGQMDWRHMHQFNSRLSGKMDDFDLLRARIYGDLWYKDIFRVYVETLSSTTVNQDLPPLKTDLEPFELLNAFFDLKFGELDGKPIYLRGGYQELLLGSERLLTPLEWANTRQNFLGVHSLWSNGKFDVDTFWVHPVIPDNVAFPSIDHNVNFYGAFGTYHPNNKQWVDLYWLFVDNADKSTTSGITQDPTSVHTIGTRWTGQEKSFLWDFEPMGQLGQRGSEPIHAGAVTAGLGYYCENVPMNPTFWTYYDWASGDHSPNAGNYSTFNQLFGFGHYYLGFMDLIGRENIRDWNTQVYLYPAKWININIQYHFLNLDSARDALYGPSGSVSRVSLNGSAGGDVGQELTFIVNLHLGPHSDILTGWSKLYAGDFIRNTATSPGGARSPEMFYLMYNYRW
jgi:hypothetical protein